MSDVIVYLLTLSNRSTDSEADNVAPATVVAKPAVRAVPGSVSSVKRTKADAKFVRALVVYISSPLTPTVYL